MKTHGQWVIGQYFPSDIKKTPFRFWRMPDNRAYTDSDFQQINETRILTPDEVPAHIDAATKYVVDSLDKRN